MYMNDIIKLYLSKYSEYLPKSLLLVLAARQLQSLDNPGMEYWNKYM